jgi:hypothetical protein
MERMVRNDWLASALGTLVLIATGACATGNGAPDHAVVGGAGDSGGGADDVGGGEGDSGSTGFTGDVGSGPEAGGDSGKLTCNHAPTEDGDGDGWTTAEGDCNDCDPNVNPGAIEVIAQPGPDGKTLDPADEDCDGKVDDVAPSCDDGLLLDDTVAKSGAKAIGLCQSASPDGTRGKPGYSAGLIEARYVYADGSPDDAPGLTVGLLSTFGPKVKQQEGARMLALSSGHARAKSDPGWCVTTDCKTVRDHVAPPNFPATVPKCGGGPSFGINDDVALQVKLRAPTNATGYRFDFKFYSNEFPNFVCTNFNDQFIALVSPPPTGAQYGNISFDSVHNPVSVNVAFFDVCDPTGVLMWTGAGKLPLPSPYCPKGTGELEGTGFDGTFEWGHVAGATSWVRTQAPIAGGAEFTIRFAIWDTNDQQLDSTVLIDNFSWIAGAGTNVDVRTDVIH